MAVSFFALYISPIFYRLIYMSLTALSFGVFFALFGKTLDRIISPKWKYIFWFLMLLALALPFRIKSPISISDMLNLRAIEQFSFYNTSKGIKSLIFDFALPIIWILGMIAGFIRIGIGSLKLKRAVDKASEGKINDSLRGEINRCCDALGLSSSITRAVMQGYIKTPAVTGLLRPTVLLPEYFGQLSLASRQSILLHELAHFKRGDTKLNLLLSVLKAVYWFNPLIYPLIRKFREDIELANDSYVLGVIGEENHSYYKAAVLESLELFVKSDAAGNLLCMTDTAKSIRRRIKMLDSNAFFKKRSLRITALCTAVCVLAAMLFLSSRGISGDVSLELIVIRNNTVSLEFTNGTFGRVKTTGECVFERKNGEKWERVIGDNGEYIYSQLPMDACAVPKGSYDYGEGFSYHFPTFGLTGGATYRLRIPYILAGSSKFATAEFKYDEIFNADSITKSDIFSRPDDGADAYLKGEITRLIRKNRSGKTYNITNNDMLRNFVYSMKSADWFDDSGCRWPDCPNGEVPLYEVELEGENPVKFKFYQICDRTADVDVIVNGIISYRFFTSAESALEIKSFCEKSYELHFTSQQHTPDEKSFLSAADSLFANMEDKDIKQLKKTLRDYHKYLEYVILCGIEEDIKEPEGLFWDKLKSESELNLGWDYGVYGDLFAPEAVSLALKNKAFSEKLLTIKNKTALAELRAAAAEIEAAINNNSLEGLINAHSLLHDYDYFISNYPTNPLDDGFVDSSGLTAYFGATELLGAIK